MKQEQEEQPYYSREESLSYDDSFGKLYEQTPRSRPEDEFDDEFIDKLAEKLSARLKLDKPKKVKEKPPAAFRLALAIVSMLIVGVLAVIIFVHFGLTVASLIALGIIVLMAMYINDQFG